MYKLWNETYERHKLLKRHTVVAIVLPGTGDSHAWDARFSTVEKSGEYVYLGSAQDGTSMKGFLTVARLEGMRIKQENYTKVVELFDFMHPQKQIIESINDLIHPSILLQDKGLDVIERYSNTIHPPLFCTTDLVVGIDFWVVDHWTGDLEQWKVRQDEQKEIDVIVQIVETSVVYTPG